MIDPATLYNEAELSIVTPSPESLPTSPPRSTLSPSSSSDAADLWINSLLRARNRSATYYDETLTFYLLITLSPSSSSSLSRSQAHSFFLQSLDEPHLTLASSLSYYEGAESRPNLQQRNHSALTSHYPLTPHPNPSTSNSTPTTADPSTRESLLISTKSFDDPEEGEGEKGKESIVWVGQTKEGNWVGVWQFDASLRKCHDYCRLERIFQLIRLFRQLSFKLRFIHQNSQ